VRAKRTFLSARAAKVLDAREEGFLRADLDRCWRRIVMLEL